jgi:N-acetylmuramoyl-L-alanine amidase
VADGAEGVVTHVRESKVNLEVALLLEPLLESRGITVVMVRHSENVDISNVERAKIANEAHADLTVRLHCDGSTDASRKGISIQIPARAKYMNNPGIVGPSADAARDMERALVAVTGAKDLGLAPRTDLAGFNWSNVPTILVEMGFLSNRAEDRRLNEAAYQHTLAQGLAQGVSSYLGTPR